MDSFKDQLKMILLENKITMTQLVQRLNDKFNRSDSIQNLNNKLTKGTIRYSEVMEIADALDYEILWMPKNNGYIPPEELTDSNDMYLKTTGESFTAFSFEELAMLKELIAEYKVSNNILNAASGEVARLNKNLENDRSKPKE